MSSLYKYKKIKDIPNKISIFPLNGALLLPRSQLPLNIFEPRYLEMGQRLCCGLVARKMSKVPIVISVKGAMK